MQETFFPSKTSRPPVESNQRFVHRVLGALSLVKSGRGVKLSAYFHPVLRLRTPETITPVSRVPPFHAAWLCTGWTSPLRGIALLLVVMYMTFKITQLNCEIIRDRHNLKEIFI